jgi:phosphohistidine swiveling domain-containing protein
MSYKFPGWIRKRIFNYYSKLAAPVAVRSSMWGEDSAHASFAGQLDTFLNVESPESLLEAVLKCYASVLNSRFNQYLKEKSETDASFIINRTNMAVVVQKMVDAKVAGVAFTADPLSGQPKTIIEAAVGSVEGIVAGTAVPNRYVFDSRGVLQEEYSAEKNNPVLTENQLEELIRLVNKIATKMENPQDIEWIWDGSDFYILQTRPITTLSKNHIYSHKLVSDMSPGLIKPLLWSTNVSGMNRNVFGRLFTRLIGPNKINFRTLTRRIYSRVYADMTVFGELLQRIGLPPNFFESMTLDEYTHKKKPRLNLRLLQTFFRSVIFLAHHARIERSLKAFLFRHSQEIEGFRNANWTVAKPGSLIKASDRLIRLHGQTQWYMWIVAMNMTVRNKLLKKMLQKLVPGVEPSDLIRGLIGLKALEPNQEIRKMALLFQKLPEEIQQQVREGKHDLIQGKLENIESGKMLRQMLSDFFRKYGFLSISGTDFSESPWAENPGVIWSAICRFSDKPGDFGKNARLIRTISRGKVLLNLSPFQRFVFNKLLKSTIRYIGLREKTSFRMSEDAYQMRRIFLELGRRFTTQKLLAQPGDIFFLYYREVKKIVKQAPVQKNLRQIISRRKSEAEAHASLEIEETIIGDTFPQKTVIELPEKNYLLGIPGSSGIAKGFARLVKNPAEIKGTLTKDDILIVLFTDVGWTPLFPGIGGLVAETGGQLSHSSIIAREYGLPAVVSVKKATQYIREGQAITIDGHTGRVYLE